MKIEKWEENKGKPNIWIKELENFFDQNFENVKFEFNFGLTKVFEGINKVHLFEQLGY